VIVLLYNINITVYIPVWCPGAIQALDGFGNISHASVQPQRAREPSTNPIPATPSTTLLTRKRKDGEPSSHIHL
jgi:hypothetical protein